MPGQRGQAATSAVTQATAPAAGGSDDIRQQQRRTWDRFAPGWAQWDALVMKMLAPVAAQMIGALAVRDGSEHLDIAAGTGEPGLPVAALIPRGRVVLTGLSGRMLAAADATAAARRLANVETRQASADDLPFGDASFDTISCRFGLMFVPGIAAAVAGLRRVLRPRRANAGGGLCIGKPVERWPLGYQGVTSSRSPQW